MKWLDQPYSRQMRITHSCFLSGNHQAPHGIAVWEYLEVTDLPFSQTQNTIWRKEKSTAENGDFFGKLWSHHCLMSIWQFLMGEYQTFLGKSSLKSDFLGNYQNPQTTASLIQYLCFMLSLPESHTPLKLHESPYKKNHTWEIWHKSRNSSLG